MTHLADAIFWLSLAILSLLAVIYTISYGFVGRVRELLEAERSLLRASYEANLARTKSDLQHQRTLDPKLLTDIGKSLQQGERSLRTQLRKLASVDRALNVKTALYHPGAFALLSTCPICSR